MSPVQRFAVAQRRHLLKPLAMKAKNVAAFISSPANPTDLHGLPTKKIVWGPPKERASRKKVIAFTVKPDRPQGLKMTALPAQPEPRTRGRVNFWEEKLCHPKPEPFSLITHGYNGSYNVVPRKNYGKVTYDMKKSVPSRGKLVQSPKLGQTLPSPRAGSPEETAELATPCVFRQRALPTPTHLPAKFVPLGSPSENSIFPGHWMQE
eukprot:g1597.t1